MNEVTSLIRRLEKRGVSVEPTRSGHYRASLNGSSVTIPGSPSDHRSLENVYAQLRRDLGVDIRKPHRKKGTTDDFALSRLRERILKQMERGATAADLGRLAVVQSDDKRIGGWKSPDAASVGIAKLQHGGRLVKANHDSLAAALRTLESSNDEVFTKHLDAAAERFGMKRHTHEPPPAPVEIAPEPVADEQNIVALPEEEHRELTVSEIARALTPEAEPDTRVEVTVKVELGEKTLALIEKLIGGR